MGWRTMHPGKKDQHRECDRQSAISSVRTTQWRTFLKPRVAKADGSGAERGGAGGWGAQAKSLSRTDVQAQREGEETRSLSSNRQTPPGGLGGSPELKVCLQTLGQRFFRVPRSLPFLMDRLAFLPCAGSFLALDRFLFQTAVRTSQWLQTWDGKLLGTAGRASSEELVSAF